jgi:hypothetical protein
VTLERVVTLAILTNLALLVASWIDDGHEDMYELGHMALLAFFTAELTARLRRLGWSPRRIMRDRQAAFLFRGGLPCDRQRHQSQVRNVPQRVQQPSEPCRPRQHEVADAGKQGHEDHHDIEQQPAERLRS